MRRALLLALLAAGCSVRTQGLAGSAQVAVQVSDPEVLGLPGPFGVAVVWIGDGALRVTAVAPLAQTDGGVTVTVEPPADFAALDAGPLEALSTEAVPVYRPRLVVFQDTNDSGWFEFDGLDAGQGDRVLGVDGNESEAYVLDTDGMLRAFNTGEADAYYAATGGAFTPYLRVFLDNQSMLDLEGDNPVPVSVIEGQVADTDLACQRTVDAPLLSANSVSTSPTVTHVNAGLDPAQVCQKGLGICVQETLENEPPSLIHLVRDDHVHIVECQQSGALESVQVFDAVQTCAGCQCRWNGTLDLYLAASAARPSWWPCGLSVGYCPSGNLFAVSLACTHQKP